MGLFQASHVIDFQKETFGWDCSTLLYPISFILENEGTEQTKWSLEIVLLDLFSSFFI